MLSRYIAAPFIAFTGIALGLTLLVGSSYAIWIIPPVVILAGIYVLSPQIDWWYFKKHPPVMPEGMIRILEKFYPYYKALKPELKPHFRNRLMMYLRCVEFIGKPEKEVPEDIMMIVAASITQLTFGLEDYRLSKFERIVIYPHPFPSPQYKEHIHNSEIFEEDGVLLFAVEPLLAAFRFPHKYYNLALHEYAKVFMLSYPNKEYPMDPEKLWEHFEIMGAYKKEQLMKYIGLPEVDAVATSINYFFTFPQMFQKELPQLFERYKTIFNQDPTQPESPVIHPVNYSQF